MNWYRSKKTRKGMSNTDYKYMFTNESPHECVGNDSISETPDITENDSQVCEEKENLYELIEDENTKGRDDDTIIIDEKSDNQNKDTLFDPVNDMLRLYISAVKMKKTIKNHNRFTH